MKPLGELTIGASDTEKWLGPITLEPDDDTVWLEVTQLSTPCSAITGTS